VQEETEREGIRGGEVGEDKGLLEGESGCVLWECFSYERHAEDGWGVCTSLGASETAHAEGEDMMNSRL